LIPFEGTLVLNEAESGNEVFIEGRVEEKINCVYPKCKDPANGNDIEKFTYLD
jgi:hypothetical protein